jgi:hypothetical protein
MSINKLNFNSSNLSNEINKIINKGLNELLNDFIVNYKLYESTHNAVMNLPSVKHEINKLTKLRNRNIINESDSSESESDSDSSSDSDSETETESDSNDDLISELSMTHISNTNKVNNNSTFTSIKDMANEIIKKEVGELESKILSIIDITIKNNSSSYAHLYNAFKNMEEKYDSLQQSLQELKQISYKTVVYDLTNDNSSNDISDVKIKVEKENIKLEINEIQSDVVESISELNLATSQSEIVCNNYDKDESEEDEEENNECENISSESESEEEHEEEDNEDTNIISESEKDEEDGEDEEYEEENEKCDNEGKDEEDNKDDNVGDEEEEENDGDDSVETEKNEEEEEEYTEIEIDDVNYCTNDEENGFIYQLIDGDVGDKVGYLKDGEPFFYADEYMNK